MAALTQATASFVADQTITAFAFDQFTQRSPTMPALFNQQGSSIAKEIHGSTSGLSNFTLKTELSEPDEDTPIQQFSKEYAHLEYALQTKIERKVIDDQRFAFFQQFGKKIGESAMRTVETLAAKVFNEAFASAEFTSEDGDTLCSTAHTNVDGGNSQGNRGTSALTHPTVGATRELMRRFTGYRGEEIVIEPDLLLVPDEKEQDAWEVVRSSGDPDSANHKANFHNGRYGVIVWGYLSASDANNWFMIDSAEMRMALYWYWRIVLEIYGDGELMKGLRSIGGYFRSSHGVTDWRWVYGHNAAA